MFKRAVTLLPVFLSGCLAFLGPADRDVSVKDAVAARARWNSIGVTDYDVVVRTLCFCPNDGDRYRYSVRTNVLVSVVRVSTGEENTRATSGPRKTPIDGAFDSLDYALQNNAERLEVEFDDVWGFPRRLTYDIRFDVADDEYQLFIDSFTPVSR
jgi:hypothetical protein